MKGPLLRRQHSTGCHLLRSMRLEQVLSNLVIVFGKFCQSNVDVAKLMLVVVLFEGDKQSS